MASTPDLSDLIQRLIQGHPTAADIDTLRQVFPANMFSVQAAAGGIAIGGSVTGSAIVTGDNNVVTIVNGIEPATLERLLDEALVGKVWPANQRQRFLQLIETAWIQPVLQPPAGFPAGLPPRLPLPMTVTLPVLEPPNHHVLPPPPETDTGQSVPAGTRLWDLLQQHGSLLILGAPGAGKTISLYELARDAVEAAHRITQPIPVIVHLASWAQQRLPLATWLTGELKDRYGLDPQEATTYLQHGLLLPLLDGLDEVDPDAQRACVAAINEFPSSWGRLAVCCRLGAYRALSCLLRLGAAVTLHPLPADEIDRYLATYPDLVPLHHSVQDDPDLRQLVTNPLMLHVLVTVFTAARDPQAPPILSSDQAPDLIDTYLTILLNRMDRSTAVRLTGEAARAQRWLAWLAHRLQFTPQPLFMIEDLQPAWLESQARQRQYLLISRLLTGGLFGLGLALTGEIALSLLIQSWLNPITTEGSLLLLLTLLPATGMGLAIGGRDIWLLNRAAAAGRWAAGVATGTMGGVGAGIAVLIGTTPLVLWSHPGGSILTPAILLGCGGTVGLVAVLFAVSAWLIFGVSHPGDTIGTQDILPVDALSWSPANLGSRVWQRFRQGLIVMVSLDLLIALILIQDSLEDVILLNAIILIPLIFLSILRSGLQPRRLDPKLRPNHAIRRSGQRALITAGLEGGAVSVMVGAVVALLERLFENTTPGADALGLGLGLGLTVALIEALRYGGSAVIRHFTLRGMLWRAGVVPWRYAVFLNQASAEGLLQRVGSGYRFYHDRIRQALADRGQPADGQPRLGDESATPPRSPSP